MSQGPQINLETKSQILVTKVQGTMPLKQHVDDHFKTKYQQMGDRWA